MSFRSAPVFFFSRFARTAFVARHIHNASEFLSKLISRINGDVAVCNVQDMETLESALDVLA